MTGHKLTRWAGVVAILGGVSASAVLLALPSHAGVIGTLATSPARGTTASSITFTTSGPCSDPNATNLELNIFGTGFPSTGQRIVANTALTAFQVTSAGGYVIPLSQTLRDYGNIPLPPVTFSGRYDLVAKCRTSVGLTSLGDFTTSIWFTSPEAYQSTDPAIASPPTSTPTSSTPTPGVPMPSASQAPPSTSSAVASHTPSATPLPARAPQSAIPATSAGTLVAVDDKGAPLPTNPSLRRGEHLTVTASGFRPREQVAAELHSTPRSLAPATAGATGVLHYGFVVPTDFPAGAHTLELKGSRLTVAYPFKVAATTAGSTTATGTSGGSHAIAAGGATTGTAERSGARLPRTGVDTERTILLGLVMLLGGIILTVYGHGVVGSARGRHRYVPLHAAGSRPRTGGGA